MHPSQWWSLRHTIRQVIISSCLLEMSAARHALTSSRRDCRCGWTGYRRRQNSQPINVRRTFASFFVIFRVPIQFSSSRHLRCVIKASGSLTISMKWFQLCYLADPLCADTHNDDIRWAHESFELFIISYTSVRPTFSLLSFMLSLAFGC